MNFLLIKKSKTEPRNLVQLRFILKSGLYQIYKEKCTFFSCSCNWNGQSNPIYETKITQKIAWLCKKYLKIFFILYVYITDLRLKQNNIIFWFWYIYTRY